jgi:hypothetical protein
MSRPISLQVYVSHELAAQVRAAADAADLAVSEWLRLQINKSLEAGASGHADQRLLDKLYRQSLFAFVSLDALLSGHPDHTLRERAHAAWKKRCGDMEIDASATKGSAK